MHNLRIVLCLFGFLTSLSATMLYHVMVMIVQWNNLNFFKKNVSLLGALSTLTQLNDATQHTLLLLINVGLFDENIKSLCGTVKPL